jgi:2-oxoglutarate ferredoxin oxidoreductase subunit delta
VTETSDQQQTQSKVSFYPAWCKRCGNCVAFCPRGALAADEWGHPFLARPERCTACHLCEMLCPDFAISVGEPAAAPAVTPGPLPPERLQPQSPERLAPGPDQDEDRA